MSNRPNTRPRTAHGAHSRSAQSARAPWRLVAALGAVVVLAAFVAITTSGSDDDRSPTRPGDTIPTGETVVAASDTAYGKVIATGPALPEATPDADLSLGQTAPVIEGSGFDGSSVVAPVPDKPTVVIFLAHWCPHCQAEVPRISDWLSSAGMPNGVELVAVATSNEPTAANFPAGAWLHREGWPVPTMLDDEARSAAQAFGIGGFPYFVAVDATGEVVQRMSGELTRQQFDDLVSAARTGARP
jgi:thiol-disulfide isomerase/thioredoxin